MGIMEKKFFLKKINMIYASEVRVQNEKQAEANKKK